MFLARGALVGRAGARARQGLRRAGHRPPPRRLPQCEYTTVGRENGYRLVTAVPSPSSFKNIPSYYL